MRRFFLLIMIVLLPLRGLAGGVMSVEMSLAGLSVSQTAVVNSHVVEATVYSESQKSMQPGVDCPDHRTAADGSLENSSGSHCSTCVACQICHTVALTGVAPLRLVPVGAISPTAPGGARFASAALRTGFKPPIS